jgi:DNA-binding transcriptional LysR family regulator
MMEFELLRSFVAVAECGGFHRAAERLNLTQSTVSQQIKRLELETKRPLFRRTTRTVALTDDGEMLLGDARRLLQLEEAARRRLTSPPLSGTVRLGAVEEVAGGSLPPALGRFASSHPNVKLEVQIGVSSPLIEQLDAGRLDVVFAKRPLGTSKGAPGMAGANGMGSRGNVRTCCRRGVAAGLVPRAFRFARRSAHCASRKRIGLADRLHEPQSYGCPRRSPSWSRDHAASGERDCRRTSRSRRGKRPPRFAGS